MHSLVQEVTGIDFASYSNDLEAAKAAAMSFFEGHIERHDTGTIMKSPSAGHLVNEVMAACLNIYMFWRSTGTWIVRNKQLVTRLFLTALCVFFSS